MSSSIAHISNRLSFYSGLIILIEGTIGGVLTLLVLLSLKTFREKSCAFYLTIMSVVNIGQMLTGLLSRIMDTGFGIDWTKSSVFYCKFRFYCFQTCALISMTCLCLSAIDQYLSTCSNPRWQQLSNVKFARRISIVFIFIWLIHNIPFFIYLTPIQTICTNTNNIFRYYASYVTNSVLGKFIPLIIALLFGLLSYRNIQRLSHRTLPLVRRELDKQLTAMVLVLVAFAVIASIPYIIVFFITLVPAIVENPLINTYLQLALSLAINLIYLYFAVS